MRKQFDLELDLRNLPAVTCVEQAVVALAELHDGQILRVVSDDPAAIAAFKAVRDQTGHGLVRAERTPEGDFLFYLEKR